MFNKVLIANRGVIVSRILRTLHRLGIKAVVVYAEADCDAPYVLNADESYSLGVGNASETYLNFTKILRVAEESKVDAIHPGYGFLSENPEFIDACTASGIVFLGPTSDQVRDFGYKHRARELAYAAGVPLVPGSGLLNNLAMARVEAEKITYPVILKSTSGGGGIGMHVCENVLALENAFETVRQLSARNFGDSNVYLEAYISQARHLEVQLFGDGNGHVIALGERDCSTQRRNQKVLEECPAPALPEHVRQSLHNTAVRLGQMINYRSAGTVEFIYDAIRKEIYFLEVNTRLQVEHGVTEMVWGVDLVEWMICLGSGDLPPLGLLESQLKPRGHAIEARVYAEDPLNDFRPSTGLLTEVQFPEALEDMGLRIDHSLEAGLEITAFFDPMLAKVIAYADSRDQAAARLVTALKDTHIYGVVTNIDWLAKAVDYRTFLKAEMSTRWLANFKWLPTAIDVLVPGTLTTIQDYPGRTGYWNVGVPPSGPFDDWSFRLGNRLLENPTGAAGLEITLVGPTLCFHSATQVVIAGAPICAKIQGGTYTRELVSWEVTEIAPGEIITLGKVTEGMRTYLLVRGGITCPQYLNSRSTFTLGQFGGHGGRALRSGDRLMLAKLKNPAPQRRLVSSLIPNFGCISTSKGNGKQWEIAVTYGPHGAPDYFTKEDINRFFAHAWEVHFNSSRTGVRMIGPRPTWARTDGGEAGLHPSNIHDNAYAFGTIDFTGDMPIILGPDGPSLGGFVCPATVVRSERWKIGQLAPGDHVRFIPITIDTARALELHQIESLKVLMTQNKICLNPEIGSPIIRDVNAAEGGVRIVYRRAGDDFLLIEFGPRELDIALRFRAHAWMLWLQQHPLDGLSDLTPGICSLQLHYDPLILPLDTLLIHLQRAEQDLKAIESLEIETREIHLPLSWDDPACREAIERYQLGVRPDAPWCPSNLDFIRRINGLQTIKQVRDIVFNASYLVLGLGDVYLGAPVATPLDPTQRLVTTKYNPARTWTAENSVGIGGAYLCVYGMEGPGGYQFVGRTLQMWNRYRTTENFSKDKPWLLQFFDQLRFHEVDHDTLMQIRRDFPCGRYELKSRPIRFRLADYLAELEKNNAQSTEFRNRREAAFQDEIAAWHADGQFTFEDSTQEINEDSVLYDGESSVDSIVAGSLWKLLVKEGDNVTEKQPVALIESMKMEITVTSHRDGVVVRLPVKPGSILSPGQTVVVLK